MKTRRQLKLTPEQKNIIREIIKFKKPVLSLSGPAGSGKTTIISHLVHLLPNTAVCSYTGKAAEVLRKKGVPATTIHSLIYRPVIGADGKSIRDKYGNPIFSLTDKLPDIETIIVDEASMVDKKLYADLLSFGCRILFVGDHNQLPPVAGSDIDVMSQPDFVLTTIHRNAGEIALFAQWVLNGYNPVAFANYNQINKVKFVNRWEADRYLLGADQVICAFNKTRVQLNYRIRFGKGFPNKPVVGDRIMCLKNNRQLGLFNGMQGKIKYLYHDENRMQFVTEEQLFDIQYDPGQFGKEKYGLEDYGKDDPSPFDWCYCVTAHKSQGSEWDNVIVFDQHTNRWSMQRWRYTSASRAKKSLIWVI